VGTQDKTYLTNKTNADRKKEIKKLKVNYILKYKQYNKNITIT